MKKPKWILFAGLIVVSILFFLNFPIAQTTYTGNAVSGTASFTAAQDTTTNLNVFEDTKTVIREVGDIVIDLQKATTGFDAIHTTGDVLTVRIWIKIDGTNYRQIDNATFTDNSITNHVIVKGFVTDQAFRVTAAVSADRGAYDLIFRYTYKTW